MMGFGSRAGLYLRDDQMTVVVTAGTRKPVQSFSLEPGESPGTHLSTELESRKISLRRVRVGLARPLVTVKTLEMPSARGSQLTEMVGFELERHVPFPPEDIRFDFVPLPANVKGVQRLLVAACERRTVDGALRLLEDAHLKASSVGVACHELPALLARGQRRRRTVWAHRAGGFTDLICIDQGRIWLSRTVPIKNADELANDLTDTIRLLGWADCEAIWISGDEASDFLTSPALLDLGPLAEEPPFKPAARALIQGLPDDNRGAATLALASALGGRVPGLNLLPRELRSRTMSVDQLVTASSIGVAALLGLGILIGQGYKQQRYVDRLSLAIKALEPEVKSVEGLTGELGRKKKLLETIQALDRSDMRPLPLLKDLTERIPQDAWLRTLTMDKSGLELTGQAGAANQLIPLLESSPFLERVEFTAPVTKSGDKEQFRLKAAWKNAPKAPEPVSKAQGAPAPPASATTRPAPSPIPPPPAMLPPAPPSPATPPSTTTRPAPSPTLPPPAMLSPAPPSPAPPASTAPPGTTRTAPSPAASPPATAPSQRPPGARPPQAPGNQPPSNSQTPFPGLEGRPAPKVGQ